LFHKPTDYDIHDGARPDDALSQASWCPQHFHFCLNRSRGTLTYLTGLPGLHGSGLLTAAPAIAPVFARASLAVAYEALQVARKWPLCGDSQMRNANAVGVSFGLVLRPSPSPRKCTVINRSQRSGIFLLEIHNTRWFESNREQSEVRSSPLQSVYVVGVGGSLVFGGEVFPPPEERGGDDFPLQLP
jgi:hypothetical protein